MTDHSKQARLGREGAFLSIGFRIKRKLTQYLTTMSPEGRRRRSEWLTCSGVEFLRAAGIDYGNTVIDFGCGTGTYSIPAAVLVGNGGRVVSVDTNARKLRRLMRSASAAGLENIHAVQHFAEIAPVLDGQLCQTALLYDVLHFMDTNARKSIYQTLHQFLEPEGSLSVFPKHHSVDSPARYFRNITIEDVVKEIEETGFRLSRRETVDLWHHVSREQGTLLTFHKASQI